LQSKTFWYYNATIGETEEATNHNYYFVDSKANVTSWGKFKTTYFSNTTYNHAIPLDTDGDGEVDDYYLCSNSTGPALSTYIPSETNTYGWTTTYDSGVIDYQNTATFTNSNDTVKTLYAVTALNYNFSVNGYTEENGSYTQSVTGGNVTDVSGTYKEGEIITLIATPNKGCVFEGWYANYSNNVFSDLVSTSQVLYYTMASNDVNLYAVFKVMPALILTFDTTDITTTKSIYVIIQSGSYVSMVPVQLNAITTFKLTNLEEGTYTIIFKGVLGLNITGTGLTEVDLIKRRYQTTVTGVTSVNVTIS